LARIANGDQAALDQQMRIVAHDVAVLAGTRFGFIGVDDEIVRAVLHHLRHERPLQPRREARAAAPAQAGRLDLIADPFGTELHQLFGGVPRAALLRLFEAPVVAAVQVGEDAVLIEKHDRYPLLLLQA
jgi:hypothetical protein